MRADAGAALGAAGLVLAVYFLWKNNAAGSMSSSPSSSTPTIFSGLEVEGSGGSTDRSETQGSGSGAAGVITMPYEGFSSGTAAGIVTGAGRAPQDYAAGAAFMPVPKQAVMTANGEQTAIKPTISGVQAGVIQGKGVTGAVQATPKNEALYSGVKVVTDLTADILNSVVPVSAFTPVGTEQGKKNAADNVYDYITNPVEYVVTPFRWLASSVGGLFK